MGLSRSTYYYQREHKDRAGLLLKMEAIVMEFPKYGYRRVTKALHRLGIFVNHKVILNLMREKGWLCRQKRSFVVKTTDSNHPYPVFPNRIKNLVVTRLNQVWVADITMCGFTGDSRIWRRFWTSYPGKWSAMPCRFRSRVI